jgi:hypothetical protein
MTTQLKFYEWFVRWSKVYTWSLPTLVRNQHNYKNDSELQFQCPISIQYNEFADKLQ